MSSIESVCQGLNFPSGPRLKQVLTTRGIQFNASDVDRLVRGETTRQVQAPRYAFDGNIAATDLNSRWVVDLIGVYAAPSEDAGQCVGLRPTTTGGHTCWWCRMCLADKRPQTVAAAFQLILDRAGVVPNALMSDGGA